METDARKTQIRELNDRLRTTGLGGQTFVTRGIAALSDAHRAKVLLAVASFDDFQEENDPWKEHDCAVVAVEGHRVIWKIDYYDRELAMASPDPTDPAVTCRVLTIMLAEEY